MGNSTWDNALDPFPIAVGAAFGTFTAIQDVSPQPLPICYGNELRVGSKMELEAIGEFATTGAITMALGFYYGTTAVVLAQNTAITTGTAVAWPFHLRWKGIITALGSAGTIVGTGFLDYGTSLTAITSVWIPATQALRTVTIDTTVAKTLGVCATLGTSNAGNTVKVNDFTAKILNQGKTS